MAARPVSPRTRRTVGIAGLVLLVVGLALVVYGGGGFLAGIGEVGGTSMVRFALLAAGLLLTALSLAALNTGFLVTPAEHAAARVCEGCGGGCRAGARFCDACGHARG